MLRERLDGATFTRIRGRGGAVYQLGSAVTMIAGGLLYVLHPTYPFVALFFAMVTTADLAPLIERGSGDAGGGPPIPEEAGLLKMRHSSTITPFHSSTIGSFWCGGARE